MSKQDFQDYIVTATGWTAGQHRTKGDPLKLTIKQAQYENVILKSEADARVELVGSLDDPTVKSSGLDKAAKVETKKRAARKK